MRHPQLVVAIFLVANYSSDFSVDAQADDAHSFESKVHNDTVVSDITPTNVALDGSSVNHSRIDAAVNDDNMTPASTSMPLSPARPIRNRISNPIKFSIDDKNFRQVASALSIVIGIFLLFVVFNRSIARRTLAPHEMIEVLGRTAVTPKHNLHLIRVHDRLILLAETPQGLQQLETMPSPDVASNAASTKKDKSTPIHDPEAQRLLDMIRQNDGWSSADPATERLRDTSYVA